MPINELVPYFDVVRHLVSEHGSSSSKYSDKIEILTELTQLLLSADIEAAQAKLNALIHKSKPGLFSKSEIHTLLVAVSNNFATVRSSLQEHIEMFIDDESFMRELGIDTSEATKAVRDALVESEAVTLLHAALSECERDAEGKYQLDGAHARLLIDFIGTQKPSYARELLAGVTFPEDFLIEIELSNHATRVSLLAYATSYLEEDETVVDMLVEHLLENKMYQDINACDHMGRRLIENLASTGKQTLLDKALEEEPEVRFDLTDIDGCTIFQRAQQEYETDIARRRQARVTLPTGTTTSILPLATPPLGTQSIEYGKASEGIDETVPLTAITGYGAAEWIERLNAIEGLRQALEVGEEFMTMIAEQFPLGAPNLLGQMLQNGFAANERFDNSFKTADDSGPLLYDDLQSHSRGMNELYFPSPAPALQDMLATALKNEAVATVFKGPNENPEGNAKNAARLFMQARLSVEAGTAKCSGQAAALFVELMKRKCKLQPDEPDFSVHYIGADTTKHFFLLLNAAPDANISDPSTWGEDAVILDPHRRIITPASEMYGPTHQQYYSSFKTFRCLAELPALPKDPGTRDEMQAAMNDSYDLLKAIDGLTSDIVKENEAEAALRNRGTPSTLDLRTKTTVTVQITTDEPKEKEAAHTGKLKGGM